MAEEFWADTIEERFQRAAEARRIADAATDDSATKADFLEIEQRWKSSARNYGSKTMLISEDYKQLAERCMKLASECSEPNGAEALRALALDYLARAGGPAGLGRALSWE